jgi:uncharacterized coiled-coil protein SlyX
MGLIFMGYVFQVYFKEGIMESYVMHRRLEEFTDKVIRLEAICQEQDKTIAELERKLIHSDAVGTTRMDNIWDKLKELEQQLCKLKESDGRNSGVVYGHYMDGVNVAQVYTEQHEQQDKYMDMVADVVKQVEESHECTGYQDHLSQKDADKLQQQVEEPDVTMKDAAPVYLNPKYDGPVGP